MDNEVLVRMANQITAFFQAYPRNEALDGIAKHIHNTWDRRMRDALHRILETPGSGLDPLCSDAMSIYFKGPNQTGKRAVVAPGEPAPKGAKPSFADGGGDAG